MPMLDWGTLGVAGLMAASNLGGLALLGKHYARRVDKHDEELPEMLAAIQALSKAAAITSKCMDELYASRNQLKDNVTQIREKISAQREICNERWDAGNHPKRRTTDWEGADA
jgi:Flp pilus assembly protein TadB